MYTVIAKFHVVPEKLDEFKSVAYELGTKSKEEEGVLYYTMHVSDEDPTLYASIEIYKGKASHSFHAGTDHVAEFFPKLSALSSTEPIIEFYSES